MSQPTRSQTLPWDFFKLVVALILVIILILLLLRACGGPNIASVTPEPEAVTLTESATGPVTQAASGIVTPVITSPKAGDKLEAGTVKLAGTGQFGSSLDIADNGQVVGSTLVGVDGAWSFETNLQPGLHEFIARVPDGSLQSQAVKVTVTTVTIPQNATPLAAATQPPAGSTPSAAPTTTANASGSGCPVTGVVISGYKPDKFHYVVGTCDTLSSIAAALGIRLKDLIAANPQIKDPNLIFPGQVLNLP